VSQHLTLTPVEDRVECVEEPECDLPHVSPEMVSSRSYISQASSKFFCSIISVPHLPVTLQLTSVFLLYHLTPELPCKVTPDLTVTAWCLFSHPASCLNKSSVLPESRCPTGVHELSPSPFHLLLP
jgi:hypothetical protein